MCQLVDQPRTAGRPVDTFGCLPKIEPERLPTVSVDQRNATCRPEAPLVAALPHGHQVAMRPSRPHCHLMAAVAARPVAIAGQRWPSGPTLRPLRQRGPSWLPLCGASSRGSTVERQQGKAGPLCRVRKGATLRPLNPESLLDGIRSDLGRN